MALNLPALPPLPAYPTGSDATPEAIVNWRELARLHTWHEELRQRAEQAAAQDAVSRLMADAQIEANRIAALGAGGGVKVAELIEIIKLLLPAKA